MHILARALSVVNRQFMRLYALLCTYVLEYARLPYGGEAKRMMEVQEWFTVEEAAKYLRVSRRTIYKLIEDGRLTSHALGAERHKRFRRAELDRSLGPAIPADAPADAEERGGLA